VSFLETVDRARTFLERHRRVSLRALRREFALDRETLFTVLSVTQAPFFARIVPHEEQRPSENVVALQLVRCQVSWLILAVVFDEVERSFTRAAGFP
jgi:hypothetical protein